MIITIEKPRGFVISRLEVMRTARCATIRALYLGLQQWHLEPRTRSPEARTLLYLISEWRGHDQTEAWIRFRARQARAPHNKREKQSELFFLEETRHPTPPSLGLIRARRSIAALNLSLCFLPLRQSSFNIATKRAPKEAAHSWHGAMSVENNSIEPDGGGSTVADHPSTQSWLRSPRSRRKSRRCLRNCGEKLKSILHAGWVDFSEQWPFFKAIC